ncbi:hypothetical protein ZIOFF_021727 [Zingiber officinale]|uniref:Amino acid transporter transmembrane domain-containing protein n=1 Tax=Zingiber officinale TaxID=94328 RepID=A0A8J5H1V9_ZINOF|nr:hypothetical protein ZIOFF_021727 [Zingiber officinale]
MVLSVSQERPPSISYQPLPSSSFCSAAFLILNAFGIIAFAFRGHNLALEIQKLLYLGFQTIMASIFKHPAHVPMWRGAKVAYLLIAMCLFPIATGGFWAYGNLVSMPVDNEYCILYYDLPSVRGILPTSKGDEIQRFRSWGLMIWKIGCSGGRSRMPQGGILNALYIYHSHDIPRGILATTFLLVVFNCLNSFQIYSMHVFDSFEAGYTSRTNRPCSIWVRSGFRVFYGFISFFIGVALPFLSSLAGILGGLTLPVSQFVGIMESKTWIWNRKSTGKNIEKGKTLELEKSVENLNEQLSSVRSESNAKDDLLAKQSKVAEEAISC